VDARCCDGGEFSFVAFAVCGELVDALDIADASESHFAELRVFGNDDDRLRVAGTASSLL
jgi:hypothetical protein